MIRIEIEGKFVELSADIKLSFQWTNSLLKFGDVEISRTQTFEIPRTPKNERIFEFSGIVYISGSFIRVTHAATIYYSGGQISGNLYCSKVTGTSYECIFVYGNLLGLQKLKDDGKNIQECLKTNSNVLMIPQRLQGAASQFSTSGVTLYNYLGLGYSNAMVNNRMDRLPSVGVNYLFTLVKNAFGISIDTSQLKGYQKTFIAQLGIKLSSFNITKGVTAGVNDFAYSGDGTFFRRVNYTTPSSVTSTQTMLVTQSTSQDYLIGNHSYTMLQAQFACKVTVQNAANNVMCLHGKTDIDQDGNVTVVQWEWVGWGSYGSYRGVTTEYVSFDDYHAATPPYLYYHQGITIDCQRGDFLAFINTSQWKANKNVYLDTGKQYYMLMDTYKNNWVGNTVVPVGLTSNNEETYEVPLTRTGQRFFLQSNLPKISVLDLIKSVCLLAGGTFYYSESAKTIYFYDLSMLKKSNALSLEDMGVLSFKQKTVDIDGFAQDNYIRVENADVLDYRINNSNIDEEQELFKSQIATSFNAQGNFGDNAYILDSEINEKGELVRTDDNKDMWVMRRNNNIPYLSTLLPIDKLPMLRTLSLQQIFTDAISVVVTVKMPLFLYMRTNEKSVFSYKGLSWLCKSAKWSDGQCEMELVKI